MTKDNDDAIGGEVLQLSERTSNSFNVKDQVVVIKRFTETVSKKECRCS